MRTLSLASLLTPPLLCLFAATQNPPPQPPTPRPLPDVPVTPTEGGRIETARISKAMQGLWVLKKLDWPHLQGVNSESRGFCLVSDNHVSFEVHIGLKGPDQKLNDVMFDSGLWRFEVVEPNHLVLTLLIGSFLDKDNRVAFREEGKQVRYQVQALAEQMIWRKEDGQRLVFERFLDGGPARLDVYGRNVPEKKSEAPVDDGAKKEPPK